MVGPIVDRLEKISLQLLFPSNTGKMISMLAEDNYVKKEIGVLRDTARAPQPPTNQPAGHLMSQQGLNVPKKAYFGAKTAVFGPNML